MSLNLVIKACFIQSTKISEAKTITTTGSIGSRWAGGDGGEWGVCKMGMVHLRGEGKQCMCVCVWEGGRCMCGKGGRCVWEGEGVRVWGGGRCMSVGRRGDNVYV